MATTGRTAPSKIRLSTVVDVEPEIELQLDAPAKVGALVRVTVFDEDLFRTGDLSKEYNKVFSTFIGTLEPFLPPAVRDPANLIDNGMNGVLLTYRCAVVDEVPKAAERKHRKWAFGAAQSPVTCQPPTLLVDIALGMRDVNNEILFGPLIRLPSAKRFRQRRIVIVLSDADTNEILYSNTWRTPRFIKHNRQGTPTILDSQAAEVALAAKVGGSGEGTGTKSPSGRALPAIDVSGKWEAFADEDAQIGEDFPVLMVQLNTAGGAIAGWWAPPPERVTAHEHLRIRQPELAAPLKRGEFAALLGHFEDSFYEILWGPSGVTQDPSPELVGAIKASPNSKAGIGLISILDKERLRVVLQRGEDTTTLFLSKSDLSPRWSNTTIDQAIARAAEGAARVRRLVRGQHEQPIPLAFWASIQPDMTATGRLGKLIVSHENTATNDTIGRRTFREQISDYLEALGAIDAYSEMVAAHFAGVANEFKITIDGRTQTTYDWLMTIATGFMSGLAAQGLEDNQIVDRLPNGFKDMGIVARNLFVYKIEFFALGAQVGAGIKAGLYAFEAEVTRKLIVRDIEQDPTPPDPWTNTKKKLFGAFGDLGISVGRTLKVGASKLLTEANFRTYHNITPASFKSASFYVMTATAIPVSGALLSGSAGSSAVIVMTVNAAGLDGKRESSVRMVAGVDKGLTLPDPSKPKQQLIKKNPIGGSINLFSLTLGVGWMTDTEAKIVQPPTAETDPEDTLGRANRVFGAFFRKNSATLEGRNLSALEEALAIERAIFVSGGGHARAAGHASPEGPDNFGLSQRRADNVIKVLQDAFGEELAVSTGGIGFGHNAALRAGLIRPEDIPPGPAGDEKRKLYRQQEATLFPLHRRVMLLVNGIMLIDIRVGKAGTGG